MLKPSLVGTFVVITACLVGTIQGENSQAPARANLSPIDVFQLEYASDPQISPDGRSIVYVRTFMDIMVDQRCSNLWIIKPDGSGHRRLATGETRHSAPRWSPNGDRVAFLAGDKTSPQIHMRWMDTGDQAKLTQLERPAADLAWSPDGKALAFSMLVPEKEDPLVTLPPIPEGARWADPAKVIRRMLYRADGEGYLEEGNHQIFVLNAEGGTPRQVTHGPFDHRGPLAWTPDGRALLVSANRRPDADFNPLDSELYEISVDDGAVKQLTNRFGPASQPAVSPDGRLVAYVGFDDRFQGYQVTALYVMNRDGSQSRVLTPNLDRDAANPVWSADGRRVYFQFDSHGNTKLAFVSLDGELKTLADSLGGESLSRPYPGGSFSVSRDGALAFTSSRPDHPADVSFGPPDSGGTRRLTNLNGDLFSARRLGPVEELWYESSFDGRRIQAWVAKPPDFDSSRKYPLVLEIHGGPFENYGDRFAAEMQLYAGAGYVVLYVNPRGSTSYGEEFGNLIHHNYPGQDYDDLMSGVDALIDKGYVDENNLFVTGGSGGGVLTAWIIGKTDRFRAAVVGKPVINWFSFALTADMYNFFYRYWFPGLPWEETEHYMKRSPISLVGNVTTPTMLLTGESDHRTPISESEQYFQALKLRNVETVMVRVPGASHDIAQRPSQLMAKVAHVLAWFDRHRAPVVSPGGE